MRARRWISSLARLCVLLMAAGSAARADEIPAAVQAVLFKKIFQYDRAQAGHDTKLLVVHGSDSGGSAGELVSAFRAAGVAADPSSTGDLTRNIATATVVYVMPDAQNANVRSLAAKNHVLTVTGAAGPAEAAEVSVGIGQKEDHKPEIVINLNRTKTEGHEFKAELLRLVRVVQ